MYILRVTGRFWLQLMWWCLMCVLV